MPRKRCFSYPCLGENKTLKVRGLNGPSSHFFFFLNIDFFWLPLVPVATRGIFAVSFGVFHCSVQAPEHVGSVVAHRLNCPKSCGILTSFPDQGSNLHPLHC